MCVYFTICSNNYLSFATVLHRSLKRHQPDCRFMLFLCDEKRTDLDYTGAADAVVVLAEIEPRFTELASKYNIIELNTCLKPRAFEYLFAMDTPKAIYLDPDVCVFSSLASVEETFNSYSILLTPHIYTPIPFDGKKPDESSFLNFGIYNLGFIGLKATAEVNAFLTWWKTWTYERGYIDVYNGIFVDQLPINHAPVFFREVNVLRDMGLNMAPWNLHERVLTAGDKGFLVNGAGQLKFYHFSSFKPDNPDLPVEKYNRFHLGERPDILPLYEYYAAQLKEAGYYQTREIRDAYAELRQTFSRKKKKEKWLKRILFRKKKKNR